MPSSKELLDIISLQSDIAKLGPDLGKIMALMVERTLPLVGAESAVVELAEGQEMVYRAASGRARFCLGMRLKQEDSLSGRCVRTGQTLLCNDSETDPRVDLAACRRVGLRSMIVVPLRYDGTAVGVLKAMSSKPNTFSQDDVATLTLLSEQAAATMFFASKYNLEDLFHRATHDDLTGLANRSLFMDRFHNELAQCARNDQMLAILMIDLDGLKQINDTFGHRGGDAAIREFAHRGLLVARSSDTVARLGGDEFAVLLYPLESPDGVTSMLERLEDHLQKPCLFEAHRLPLHASAGGAVFPDDGHDVETLLDVADQRMYGSKRQYKSRHTV